MSRKRDSRKAHVESRRFDDGELDLPSQSNRALKKARRTQRDDDDDVNEAIAAAPYARGDAVSGEEAGDERTSDREDCGELPTVRDNNHEPAHVESISRASVLAPKDRESQPNKEVDNGSSAGESDEDASENEEREHGIIPRRRGMAKEEPKNDSSQSSSSSSSDGESDEEKDGGEKRPDESTAFGRAFHKIMKKKLPSTILTETMGPMLSAHKQLFTKKLEEAAEGRKAKSKSKKEKQAEAKSKSKKEKQALRQKGHTVPGLFPTAKDKELLKLATRGVVKLFNAVSKAQSVQEAVASKNSEAKEVAKRSKSTFLAMLQGGNGAASQSFNTQRQPSNSKKVGVADGHPGWSALQETFMLGKSRLKDWDKKQDDVADLKGAENSDDDSDISD